VPAVLPEIGREGWGHSAHYNDHDAALRDQHATEDRIG
jgi:hypothetical protein